MHPVLHQCATVPLRLFPSILWGSRDRHATKFCVSIPKGLNLRVFLSQQMEPTAVNGKGSHWMWATKDLPTNLRAHVQCGLGHFWNAKETVEETVSIGLQVQLESSHGNSGKFWLIFCAVKKVMGTEGRGLVWQVFQTKAAYTATCTTKRDASAGHKTVLFQATLRNDKCLRQSSFWRAWKETT